MLAIDTPRYIPFGTRTLCSHQMRCAGEIPRRTECRLPASRSTSPQPPATSVRIQSIHASTVDVPDASGMWRRACKDKRLLLARKGRRAYVTGRIQRTASPNKIWCERAYGIAFCLHSSILGRRGLRGRRRRIRKAIPKVLRTKATGTCIICTFHPIFSST
jgi:hypothetical protein